MSSLQAEVPDQKDVYYVLRCEHRAPADDTLPQGRDIVRRGRQSILLPAGNRIESTVRYLGIEVDDALEMAEQTEV